MAEKYERKDKKKKEKIPSSVRKEIRQRAKTESGGRGREAKQATKAGTAIRKTFTKSKYGRKPTGLGQKRGREITPKTPPPKMKDVEVKSRRFTSEGGQEGVSRTYKAKTKGEMEKKSGVSQREAGIKDRIPSRSDVGEKEFTENVAKEKAYKKAKAKEKYAPGSRTEASREKAADLRRTRSKYVREAGGNVRKGERRMKRHLKEKMKEEYRKGTYKRY